MDDVRLVGYDPGWPALYEAEAARLRAALPADLIRRLEHIGSTAIPGMTAKPVIDILIAVGSVEAARAASVAPMETLGYAFWADNPRRDRLFFVKGLPPAPHRTHHVHMTEAEDEVRHRLAFRHRLRTHPEKAARYAALKRDLAGQHRVDREAYTAAKSAFVDEIVAKAARAAPGRD